MIEEIQGQLERITYSNQNTGYTIAKLRVKGRHDLITFTGNFIPVNPGEILKLKGHWHNHPKYGEQFKVESYQTVVPATADGIEKYLSSGMIKGIGPVMAKRIVAMYGVDTLDIIEHAVDRLSQVEGVGEKRIAMIQRAWEEQKEIKDVMLFLQGNGVSSAYATKIYKQYGNASISIVRDNPYRLATDIIGIGFIIADKIAKNMGIPNDSEIRAEAGILYVLQKLSGEGHVFYPYGLLIDECREVLNTAPEIILKAMNNCAFEKKIVIEDFSNGDGLRTHDKAVYLTKFFVSEIGVAGSLKRLLFASQKEIVCHLPEIIEWVQQVLNITLAGKQDIAIKEALRNKVLVITGGPGTGKTTLINSILNIYQKLGRKVLLAAPTGRAAKRMEEASGHVAKTIHRLLEINPREGGFKRNETNPLDADLFIIDEASMVDTVLMHHFLKAIPDSATVIFVGDIFQLPSVGAGNVLKDIIGSGIVLAVQLNEIFRQSQDSLIVVNAHRVNRGDMPILTYEQQRLQDFYFIEGEEPENIVEKIVSLCLERIPQRFQFNPVRDVQVLTAMHKGLLGTSNLNSVLQDALNPSTQELQRGNRKFRTGDKVMQVVNNYDKDVFNGDIGIIKKIDREFQILEVELDGKSIEYEYHDLDELVLAYAISVHKAQGSEYPVVIMPVHTQHFMMLQRNLLYTAITRGRKLVILIGTKKALAIAIRNNTPHERYTYLRNRLSSLTSVKSVVAGEI